MRIVVSDQSSPRNRGLFEPASSNTKPRSTATTRPLVVAWSNGGSHVSNVEPGDGASRWIQRQNVASEHIHPPDGTGGRVPDGSLTVVCTWIGDHHKLAHAR